MILKTLDNCAMSGVCFKSPALLTVCGLLLGGCASAGPSPLGYGIRHIQGIDRATALRIAQDSLVELGYKLDRVDSDTGLIITRPIPTTASIERVKSSVRLSTRNRLRRVAQVRLAHSGDVATFYCRVGIQQQTAEAHRMFRRDRTISDSPGQTPIEREAATTEEQNTVWRTIHRDKAAERRILKAIVEHSGSAPG